jgi:gamma-glutamylcyclotransferase (GGCT)/AIG2-like uncharacterized protein YtfP
MRAPTDDLHVFVYGSLMPGGSYWARYCAGKVTAQQRARVHGRIFCGHDGYLALTTAIDDLRWVPGWVLTLRDESVLRDFDQLEDFDAGRAPEQNDYQRVRVNYFADDDSPAPTALGEAWAYVMTETQLARAGAMEIFAVPPT